MVMVLNATFNNISVISWWSVLLVEETGIPRENHRPVAKHLPLVDFVIETLRQKFKSHPVFFSLFLRMKEVELGLLFC